MLLSSQPLWHSRHTWMSLGHKLSSPFSTATVFSTDFLFTQRLVTFRIYLPYSRDFLKSFFPPPFQCLNFCTVWTFALRSRMPFAPHNKDFPGVLTAFIPLYSGPCFLLPSHPETILLFAVEFQKYCTTVNRNFQQPVTSSLVLGNSLPKMEVWSSESGEQLL